MSEQQQKWRWDEVNGVFVYGPSPDDCCDPEGAEAALNALETKAEQGQRWRELALAMDELMPQVGLAAPEWQFPEEKAAELHARAQALEKEQA